MITQQDFYRSKRWQKFRQVVIEERTQPDGFVYCAACGQPILKKYDMVLDHIQELDDINVNDATVALNPENIQILHFRCHNEKHHRFTAGHDASYKPAQKHVYIVYGAPCSGKTSWVHDVATEADLIVDMDEIWEAIGIGSMYEKPDALKSVVFRIRDTLYDVIQYRSGRWETAYVITGGALLGDRERLAQRLGAELVYIDTPREECERRLAVRLMSEEQRSKWREYIAEWFDTFQPEREGEGTPPGSPSC